MKNYLLIFILFITLCNTQEYIIGTYEQPKADLPPDSSLIIQSIFIPDSCSKKAINGNTVITHYSGYLYRNGEKIDSSLDRQSPFSVKLGAGRVIKGWEEGLLGMCQGEKRRLIIPANLGYGLKGTGGVIPGGATLVFDVELIQIK